MADVSLKKQQMEYIGITILVLGALLIGITRFKKGDKEDEVFSRTDFNRKWKEVEELEARVPQEEKGISYAVTVEREPFKSPLEEKKLLEVVEDDIVFPKVACQGMIWNSIRPQAIINGEIYDINDTLEIESEETKVTIKDITKDGIYLRYKGRDFIVRPK